MRLLVRYLISGGTGFLVNLSILKLLLFLHASPVFASYTAAFVAFWVSFFMQKYVTFKQKGEWFNFGQVLLFLLVAILNSANISFFFWSLHVHYSVPTFLAQGLASILTAIISYFPYRYIVFNNR